MGNKKNKKEKKEKSFWPRIFPKNEKTEKTEKIRLGKWAKKFAATYIQEQRRRQAWAIWLLETDFSWSAGPVSDFSQATQRQRSHGEHRGHSHGEHRGHD